MHKLIHYRHHLIVVFCSLIVKQNHFRNGKPLLMRGSAYRCSRAYEHFHHSGGCNTSVPKIKLFLVWLVARVSRPRTKSSFALMWKLLQVRARETFLPPRQGGRVSVGEWCEDTIEEAEITATCNVRQLVVACRLISETIVQSWREYPPYSTVDKVWSICDHYPPLYHTPVNTFTIANKANENPLIRYNLWHSRINRLLFPLLCAIGYGTVMPLFYCRNLVPFRDLFHPSHYRGLADAYNVSVIACYLRILSTELAFSTW